MNKMKVALATALKFPNWQLCRLCLVLLLFASSWQGSHAAYMYVKGTASPYYKIGDGSYVQMANHINTDGTTWYFDFVDNGSSVTFATSSEGANASPAIEFDSSSDSYFKYDGSCYGFNMTGLKDKNAFVVLELINTRWPSDNAVIRFERKDANATTETMTKVGGNSSNDHSIYIWSSDVAMADNAAICFLRIDPVGGGTWNWTDTYYHFGGYFYEQGNNWNNDIAYSTTDEYKNIKWPSFFTGNLYIVGDVNTNNWAPNVGIEMTAKNNEINIFEANNIHLVPGNNGFAFATQLANNDQDWATLNGHRLGANMANNGMLEITENQFYNLQVANGDDKNFIIDVEDDYDVEVNLETMQVKVSKVSVQPSTASHYNGPGYYRLQNAQTLRYANAVDNKGMEINPQTGVNSPSLNSIDLVSGDPTALPGTIIYIDGTDEIPIFGQGLDLQTQGIGTMMLTRFLLQNMESLIAGLIGSAGSVEIDPETAQQVANLPGVPIHIEEQTEGDYQGSYIAYIQATLGEDSQPIKANFVDVEGNQAHFGRNFDILMYGNGKNKWNVFPVNETDNYFIVTPCQTAVNGKYYTTLSVDFGYKILSEGVTAYIVTEVDNDGNPTLSQIATTNGLVARGASVVLESSSPDAIKLLPMDGGDQALLEGNLLTRAIDEEHLYSYFAEVRNEDTESFTTLEDGTKTFTKTFEHDEMLPANKAFFNAGCRTLQWIVNNGISGNTYQVKDDLTVMFAYGDDDEIKYTLFAKDNNGYLSKDEKPNDAIDYMYACYFVDPQAWDQTDQSNWIEIYMQGMTPDSYITSMLNLAASWMHGGSKGFPVIKNVKGTLSRNGENVKLTLSNNFSISDYDASAKPNTFITANFYKDNVQNGYFFVKPKPNEVAIMTWGVWDSSKNGFVMPQSDPEHGVNIAGLKGGYAIDRSLDQAWPQTNFVDGTDYTFYGLIRKIDSSSKAPSETEDYGEISKEYLVYPLDTKSDAVVITSVADVKVEREVAGVEYVNLAGQRSAKPWQGVNIVVTRYTDGTTRSTKAIM